MNDITDRIQLVEERDALQRELMEQCRLLGMSGEREAKHLARIEKLERERDALRTELDALKAWKEKVEAQEPVGIVEHLHELCDEWLSKLPIGTDLYARPVPAQSAPEGWQLVPIYTTQWMRAQGEEGMEDCSVIEIWRRMLAAAPKPEETK